MYGLWIVSPLVARLDEIDLIVDTIGETLTDLNTSF